MVAASVKVAKKPKPAPPVAQEQDIGVSIEPIVRVFDDAEIAEHEYTTAEAAFRANMHRVTLIRLDQGGKLPFMVRWRRRPIAHRVFNQKEVDQLIKFWDQRGSEHGRNFVD